MLMNHLIFRIISSYIGALAVPIGLLPLFAICPSWLVITFLFYWLAVISPTGMLIGLYYSDIKRKILPRHIVIRCFVAITVYLILFYIFALARTDCKRDGWPDLDLFSMFHWYIFILLFPLTSAVISDFICRELKGN